MTWRVGAAVALLATLGLVVAACAPRSQDGRGGQEPPSPDPAAPAGEGPTTSAAPSLVYVAVGASETAGIGASAPLRDAWPRLLFRTAMPDNTIFVSLGIPGATVATALREELPLALERHPAVATVWLNVNDLVAGVAPSQFERELATLVHGLRRGGATRVLVANTPPLDRLPAYLACLPASPPSPVDCRFDGQVPGPALVRQWVDEYNAATGRVVEREGAHLVDLHAVGLAARAQGTEPALVSDDGFHPSDEGHRRVAAAFADVLRRTGPLSGGG